ncbi:MAG: DUF389 domain-containing protein [Rickettsiales bacterium]
MTIATLGLLIGSATFLLGAMLLFPLMFVIINIGFTLCTLNFSQLKKNATLISTGLLVSIGTSYLIVKISPLSEPNELILSKTHPNLFDLIVAIAAGFAAGYSQIKSRGQEASAVAIAGSLSPPLAAVGFGLATHDFPVASGGLYLFTTNLITMTLSIALIAKWYGFGIRNNTSFVLWQSIVTLGVFVALSIPLAVSMQKISKAAFIQTRAEKVLKQVLDENSTLNRVEIMLPKDEKAHSPLIKAVVLSNMNSDALAKRVVEILAQDHNIEGEVEIDKISVNITHTHLPHIKPHKTNIHTVK